MHRTEPPASSMVGTSSATMRAERSITAFCADVRLATARQLKKLLLARATVQNRMARLEAFDKVLNTVRPVEGIATTETSILLSTYKL
jgi:hypothetical protein